MKYLTLPIVSIIAWGCTESNFRSGAPEKADQPIEELSAQEQAASGDQNPSEPNTGEGEAGTPAGTPEGSPDPTPGVGNESISGESDDRCYNRGEVGNGWRKLDVPAFPGAGREGHSAVWADCQMIVFGGREGIGTGSSSYPRQGYRLQVRDGEWSWHPLPLTNAPLAGYSHRMVWTGKDVIVWGGHVTTNSSTFSTTNQGALYNPTSDNWRPMSIQMTGGGTLPQRWSPSVWADGHLYIFGGEGTGSSYLGGLYRYDPQADRWDDLSSASGTEPSPRRGHTMVWTGEEIVVWGGRSQGASTPTSWLNTGARYRPATNSWHPMTTVNAPSRRAGTGVWVGDRVLIYGGSTYDPNYVSQTVGDGAFYNPKTDQWSSLSEATIGIERRTSFEWIWTGEALVLFGGTDGFRYLDDGKVFADGSWSDFAAGETPTQRIDTTMVWTGEEVIMFGGLSNKLTQSDAQGLSDVYAIRP